MSDLDQRRRVTADALDAQRAVMLDPTRSHAERAAAYAQARTLYSALYALNAEQMTRDRLGGMWVAVAAFFALLVGLAVLAATWGVGT